MTHQEQAIATDQLLRAALAFRAGQSRLLDAHRRLKNFTVEDVEAFWLAPGKRLEHHVQATAAKLVEAFQMFSAAGLVANAEDRRQVIEAQRCLADNKA